LLLSLVLCAGLNILSKSKNAFMKKDEKNNTERPIAYPRPTEADKQFNDQPEYIDQEPNKFEKDISDEPAEPAKQRSEPEE
jgi:hypothetical protein